MRVEAARGVRPEDGHQLRAECRPACWACPAGVRAGTFRSADEGGHGREERMIAVDSNDAAHGLRDAAHLRRALMLEPRGHADMYGAILTEPVAPGSHAGVLFMHNEGYSTMCGHGVIAVTTIALERGLLMPGGDGATIVYDAPAGTIRARATLAESRVVSVSFVNVPSFVLHGGLVVKL